MTDELLAKLDDEIEAAQASLRFWRKQQDVHGGSELDILVAATVDNHTAQLTHLEKTRAELARIRPASS
jgi:hypothetical protein